jgi:iron(III) transport system substrate-binding protein
VLRAGLLLPCFALAALACSVELGPPRGGAGGARSGGGPVEVLVYTSMYQTVIDAFEPLAKRTFGDRIRVRFYRAGSEKVALRLDAELRAGAPAADVLLVSDPFYYQRLKQGGHLLPYVSPATLRQPRELVDLDGHWATARISTMAIAYHPAALAGIAPPKAYRDLSDARFRGKAAFPDPLTSGTSFSAVTFLVKKYGWDFFAALRKNGVVDSGGNSAVLEKIDGQELAVGLVCLENVVQIRRKGSPVVAVLPDDGAVTIPGYVSILKGSRHPDAAREVVDLILSPEGQRLVVEGDMHSADPRQPPPPGLPTLPELMARSQPWSEEFIRTTSAQASDLKQSYERVMRR